MTKTKNGISIVSVILLCFCLTACSFFQKSKIAEEIETTVPNYSDPTIVVDTVEAHAGDTVTVKVSFVQSPGIAGCRLILEFDNENLILDQLQYGNTFIDDAEMPGDLNSPTVLSWCKLDNVDGDHTFAELTFQISDSAKIFSVFPITVFYADGDMVDLDENNVDFAIMNGSITIGK